MGERATGRPTPLRVRAPQRFEPVRRTGPLGRSSCDRPAPGHPSEVADPWASLGLEAERIASARVVPRQAGRAGQAGRHPDRRPSGPPLARDQVPANGAGQRPPYPASGIAPRDETEQDRPTTTAPAPPPAPVIASRGPSSPVDEPVDEMPPPKAERPRAAAEELRPLEPVARLEPLAELAERISLTTVDVPDIGDLVSRHVLPALVARGLLGPHESVEVVTDAGRDDADGTSPSRRSPPRSATPTTLTVAPARHTAARAVEPVGRRNTQSVAWPFATTKSPTRPPDPPQVHVHIDRVVVARPAPLPRPAQATPAPRTRPQPDHEAYLARRREGR
jgi:hypothetical protein